MSTSTPSDQADRDLRRAWVAVALVPVAFVLGTLVGEGLISLLGYGPATESVPLGAIAVAAVPALVVLAAPGVVAVYYGERSHRAGRRDGRVPAWLGGSGAVAVLALNVLAFLVQK